MSVYHIVSIHEFRYDDDDDDDDDKNNVLYL